MSELQDACGVVADANRKASLANIPTGGSGVDRDEYPRTRRAVAYDGRNRPGGRAAAAGTRRGGAMTDGAALEQLIGRARGPAGPNVDLDLGAAEGPLGELSAVVSRLNGFFVFNAGVQVFRAGPEGVGPELGAWNEPGTWKDTYEGLADGLFCFGQDIFGVQFAVEGGSRVVAFDPETAAITPLGESLEEWAAWLLEDPDVHGAASFAHAYQAARGPLAPDQRLVPLQFFIAGGGYEFENLVAHEAATAMRIRGPIARQVHDLPDGATLELRVADPGDETAPEVRPAPDAD
jgi:hypothetical protein